jgi:DNA-binding NarL/FixJ family response regulator
MSKVTQIIVVESSQLLFEGLKQILLRSGSSFLFKQALTLNEAEKMLYATSDSLIIMNPSLIQYNVKEFHHLKNSWEHAKWIGLIYLHYDAQLIALFDGIISISDPPVAIMNTIKSVLFSGSKSAEIAEDVISERETEVLKLLAKGMSNKEIADELHISINTVITHRKNITQKTGIRTVSGLTIYAVVNKIITL